MVSPHGGLGLVTLPYHDLRPFFYLTSSHLAESKVLMKKRLMMAALSLGLLAIAFATYQFQAVPASGENISLEKALPHPNVANLLIAAQTPTDTEIVPQVQSLVSSWSDPLIQGEGWLHVVKQHDSNLKDWGTLPNGQPIPLNFVQDSWYLLDGQGLVVEAVSIQRDMDGNAVQEAVFRDNTWYNLTTGDISAHMTSLK